MDEVREAMARALWDSTFHTKLTDDEWEQAQRTVLAPSCLRQADVMLAAIDGAGYSIVKHGEWMRVQPDSCQAYVYSMNPKIK